MKVEFMGPGRPVLAMDLPVGFGDGIDIAELVGSGLFPVCWIAALQAIAVPKRPKIRVPWPEPRPAIPPWQLQTMQSAFGRERRRGPRPSGTNWWVAARPTRTPANIPRAPLPACGRFPAQRQSSASCCDLATSAQPLISVRARHVVVGAFKVGERTSMHNQELLIGIARKSQEREICHNL